MKLYISIFAILCLGLSSCSVEDFGNPNGPVDTDLLNGASAADIQLMTAGLESVLRNDMGFYYTTTAIVGREWYDLSGTDPRYIDELMGKDGAPLDNNGFLTTRAYAQVYRVVRNANNLITAVENAQAGFSAQEDNGIIGIANTFKAYSLLLEANRQYENGMRIDVADPDNLGPIVSGYQNTLTEIEAILDGAAANLASAGDAFAVTLSPGFDGFDTPATFLQFNRAIAARLNAYQNDKAGLAEALDGSFIDMAGDINTGVYHVFGASGNDILNPLQVVPGQGQFYASNDHIASAEAGDTRVSSKTALAEEGSVTLQGVTADPAYRVAIYTSNTDPVAMIRNEELILLRAEQLIGMDNDEAIAKLNVVRAAAGLIPYTGPRDDNSLIAQLLYERRYSLFGEGHRWVDARRFGIFDQLPLERAGDIIHVQFPIPVTEL